MFHGSSDRKRAECLFGQKHEAKRQAERGEKKRQLSFRFFSFMGQVHNHQAKIQERVHREQHAEHVRVPRVPHGRAWEHGEKVEKGSGDARRDW